MNSNKINWKEIKGKLEKLLERFEVKCSDLEKNEINKLITEAESFNVQNNYLKAQTSYKKALQIITEVVFTNIRTICVEENLVVEEPPKLYLWIIIALGTLSSILMVISTFDRFTSFTIFILFLITLFSMLGITVKMLHHFSKISRNLLKKLDLR